MNTIPKIVAGLAASFAAVIILIFAIAPQPVHADQMSLAQIKDTFIQDVEAFLQNAAQQNLLTPSQSASVVSAISPLTQYFISPSTVTTSAASTPVAPKAAVAAPASPAVSTPSQACTPTSLTPNTAIPNDPTASPYNPIASLFALNDIDSPATSTLLAANPSVAGVPVLFFDLVAQGKNQTLDNVTVTIAPVAGAARGTAAIKSASLYDGQGTYIASATLSPAGVATFSNFSYALPVRTLKEFAVAVNVGSIGTAPTTFQASNLTYVATIPEQRCLVVPAGVIAPQPIVQAPVTSLANGVIGNPITFYAGGPQFTLGSPTVTTNNFPVNPSIGPLPGSSVHRLTATFNIAVTAIGKVYFGGPNSPYPAFGTSTGYVWVYKNGTPDFSNPKNSQYSISMTGAHFSGMTATPDGTGYILPDKGTGQLQVTYTIAYPASSTYSIALEGLNWRGFASSAIAIAPSATAGYLAEAKSSSAVSQVPEGYLADITDNPAEETVGDGSVAGSSPGYTAMQADLSTEDGGGGNVDPELGGSGGTQTASGGNDSGNIDPELGAGNSQDETPTSPPLPELYSPATIAPHLSANPVLRPVSAPLKFNPSNFIDFPPPVCDSLGCANVVG